jgi:hypothetical protein
VDRREIRAQLKLLTLISQCRTLLQATLILNVGVLVFALWTGDLWALVGTGVVNLAIQHADGLALRTHQRVLRETGAMLAAWSGR